MKLSPVFPLLLLLVAPFAVDAQLPQTHSLSLDATATSAGGSTQTNTNTRTNSKVTRSSGISHTFNTSQTTTTTSKQTLQVSVRNFGALPDTAHVEWYFIAAPASLEPGKPLFEQQFAFDQGTKDLPLAGGATQTFPVESMEITASQKRINRTRMSGKGKMGRGKAHDGPTEAGDKPSGWIVRVVADGRVLAAKASSTNLEEIAKNEARLKELIER